MIIVREVFIAKPGMASKMAAMFKKEWDDVTVMTDVTGSFNKVIIESEYGSLSEYEAEMMKYMAMKGKGTKKSSGPSHVDMYTRGKREIYRVW